MVRANSVTIDKRLVGPGEPVFIVAEAGVNHNGDPGLAARLVAAAHEAGADAVKFQTWVTEKLVAPDVDMAAYQKQNIGKLQTQFEMLKELELNYEHFRNIKAHADGLGILFLSTPDEEDSSDFLEELGVSAYKIGSAEVRNLAFLEHVARKGKPIVLSTGMTTLGEVEAAVGTIEKVGNRQLILLHCVSLYPAEGGDCNLRAMGTLASAFGYPVGFSDHTLGIEVAIAAVALGACLIEKHLTLDRTMPGPDHRASLETEEFRAMVQAIRQVERALGTGVKRPVHGELETKRVVEKAIVTTRALRAGEKLTPSDVTLRRASGLPSAYLALVVGRRVNRDLDAYHAVTLDTLE